MRSTEDKLMHIPFAGGMDQSYSSRMAPPGTFDLVQNMRAPDKQLMRPRAGFTSVGATTISPTASRITGDGSASFVETPSFACLVGDAPVVGTTSGQAFALNRTATTDRFHLHGCFSTAQPLKELSGIATIATGPSSFVNCCPASAINSQGYVLMAGNDGASEFYIDNADGQRIFAGWRAGSKVQCLAVGATFVLISQNGTTVEAATITVSTAGLVTMSAFATVATLASSTAHWDSSGYDSTHWYLIADIAGATIRIDRFAGTTSNANASITATVGGVSIWADSANGTGVWVGWYNDPSVTGEVQYRVYTLTLSGAIQSTTTIATAVDIYGPPLFGAYRDQIAGETNINAAFYVFRKVRTTGNLTRGTGYGIAYCDGTSLAAAATCWHVLPISKPDNYMRAWVMTDHGSTTNFILTRAALLRFPWNTDQEGIYAAPVVELASPEFASFGEDSPSQVAGTQGYFHAIGRDANIAFTTFAFPYNLTMIGEEPFARVAVYQYTTGDQYQWRDTESLGTSAVIAGQPTELFGQPVDQLYNGTAQASATTGGGAEVGFLHRPVICSATQDTGTGVAAGTYVYRAVYQWTDKLGNRHLSPPSDPVSVTTTGDCEVDVIITGLSASQRSTYPGFSVYPPIVLLYRTANGGTEHRLAGRGVSTSEVVTIEDEIADLALADEELLYTDGGVKDNVLAPSAQWMAFAEDRLWLGGGFQSNLVEASKVMVPGEQIAFTGDPSHQVPIPGNCTGLAYQDGQLAVFLSDQIYLVGGDGPSDQGIGSFPPPRRYAQDIGCIDGRSVVSSQSGIYFQARNGIYRIPRGYGPLEFVGSAVSGETELQTCFGAISQNTSDGHQLRFAFGDSSTDIDSILTYDETSDRWYQDTLADYVQTSPQMIGRWNDGALVVVGSLTTSQSAPILVEDSAVSQDSSVSFDQIVTTNWISPFGVGGWGHVKQLVIAVELLSTSAALYVEVQTDNNTLQTSNWTITGTVGQTAYRRVVIADQKCTQVQISAMNAARGATPTTDGFRLIGVTLEIEPSGGIALLGATETA
jgi:hypothetical protein